MNLTPLEGFLAVVADSQFSWLFYLIAFFQVSVAVCCLKKSFRNSRVAIILIIISSLLIPALLVVGFYYAIQPVA
jgi:hypothetical protein